MPNDIVWDDAPNNKGIVWDSSAPTPKKPETPLLKRISLGFQDPVIGAAQIADKAINPIRQAIFPGASSMEDVVRERDANYVAPEGMDWGRMGGNLINPVSWMSPGTSLPRAIASAGIQAGLSPTKPDLELSDFAVEKLKQTGVGASLGGALGVAGSTLRGFAPTAEARRLMDQGIQPSVGQAVGGIANTVEGAMASWPLVGGAVTRARERPAKEFGQAVFNRILPNADAPGAKLEPQVLAELNKTASALYKEPAEALMFDLEQLKPVAASIGEALQNPRLADSDRKILDRLASDYYNRLPKLSGADLKTLDSEIGYDIRRYAKGDPSAQALSDSLVEIQNSIREQLAKNLAGRGKAELAQQLSDANNIYRQLIPVNKAVSADAGGRLLPLAYAKALARQNHTDVSRLDDQLLNDLSAVAGLQPNGLSSLVDGLRRGVGTAAALGGSHVLGGGAVAPAVWAAANVGATRPVQGVLTRNSPKLNKLGKYDATTTAALLAALRSQQTGDQR